MNILVLDNIIKMGLVHELEYLRIHPSLIFGARSEHNTKSLPGAFDLMGELVPLALGRRGGVVAMTVL